MTEINEPLLIVDFVSDENQNYVIKVFHNFRKAWVKSLLNSRVTKKDCSHVSIWTFWVAKRQLRTYVKPLNF